MTSALDTATAILLEPAELGHSLLERAVTQSLGRHIDAADVYLQYAQSESFSLEDGLIKSGHFDIQTGFGFRVISGEQIGFAVSDEISDRAVLEGAKAACSIAHSGKTQAVSVASCAGLTPHRALYSGLNPLTGIADSEKISLLRRIDVYARQLDPRVIQVFATLAGSYQVVMMMNSAGYLCADLRPLVRLSVSVVVEDGGRKESGSSGGGMRSGYQIFEHENLAMQYVQNAVRQACVNLQARPMIAGVMPVVLGPGWPAVLLHEAVGHGLEGDFNRKKTSAFHKRMNLQVASPLCTIVDDGTLAERRGSLSIDDEGTKTQCTTLIERGVLKNYLFDQHNAKLMGTQSTGNGRRESYATLPLPRMTNTYMLPGESDPEEIIRSVDHGLYAVDFSGGQVDITSGKFVFTAKEAYLIENGRLAHAVKGATLIGDGPSVLMRVVMVGNDLAFDSGVGSCGKEGQTVPVGVGQPTLSISEMTVGGSQERF